MTSLPGPYRLIVFDWDGTLMDSIGTIVACTRATVAELGLPPVDEAAVRAAVGLRMAETIDWLHPGADPATVERVWATYRRLWRGTYRERLTLFHGAQAALSALAGAGYLLAVATGKSRAGLAHDLEATGLETFFHALRTADDGPAKPHPAILLDLLDELGTRPAEALMVGDSRWDLEMATAAGVAAVAVAGGAASRDTLAACRPLAILPSVADLPAWLGPPPLHPTP